jgi:hypothetical protein
MLDSGAPESRILHEAWVALARKLLIIAWYLTKRKSPFDPFLLGVLAA